MKNNANKDLWIEEVLNSTQGIERAQPGNSLYERVHEQLGTVGVVKSLPVPVKQWAAAAVLLLALNVGSVIWFTSRNKPATATNDNPLAMEIQTVTTYNY